MPRSIAIERISDLRLFARIAANGSLSAAARELGMSLGNVSSRLTRLEQALNVRLIHRSTRHLHLTAEGELFLQRQAVNAIETGKHDPSLLLAFRIARLFDMPIEAIFDDCTD